MTFRLLRRAAAWATLFAVLAQPVAGQEPPAIDPSLVPTPFLVSLGAARAEQMAGYLISVNPAYGYEAALDLARFYIREAAREGINGDLAFAQMLLETNYLRFGGQVKPEQNNFAGLGSLDGGAAGLSFPDQETGVRAQIQHLKAYGSQLPLREDSVNPRFGYVRRGSALTVQELSRRWASDPSYGDKILYIAGRLLAWKN